MHKKPNEDAEESDDEKKVQDSSVSSVSNEAALIDSELDPVGLKKAFRFAAWSSVIMVRYTRPCLPLSSYPDILLSVAVADIDFHDPHPATSLRSVDNLYR